MSNTRTSVDDLAAELDPFNPGATANAIHGFLGHLSRAERLQGLSIRDAAIVRRTFCN